MRRLAFAHVLALVACADVPDESVGEDASSGTDSSMSTTGTTAPTTGADSTGATSSSTTGVASEGSSSAAESTTAIPTDCAFGPAVDETISESAIEPIDCGFVGLDDDVAAWEAARQCARDATLDQTAYKVLWQWQDGATVRDAAFASVIGEIYAIYRFDDDSAEGTTSITVTTCTGISTATGCTVAVGEICIDCIDPSGPAELCE